MSRSRLVYLLARRRGGFVEYWNGRWWEAREQRARRYRTDRGLAIAWGHLCRNGNNDLFRLQIEQEAQRRAV